MGVRLLVLARSRISRSIAALAVLLLLAAGPCMRAIQYRSFRSELADACAGARCATMTLALSERPSLPKRTTLDDRLLRALLEPRLVPPGLPYWSLLQRRLPTLRDPWGGTIHVSIDIADPTDPVVFFHAAGPDGILDTNCRTLQDLVTRSDDVWSLATSRGLEPGERMLEIERSWNPPR